MGRYSLEGAKMTESTKPVDSDLKVAGQGLLSSLRWADVSFILIGHISKGNGICILVKGDGRDWGGGCGRVITANTPHFRHMVGGARTSCFCKRLYLCPLCPPRQEMGFTELSTVSPRPHGARVGEGWEEHNSVHSQG